MKKIVLFLCIAVAGCGAKTNEEKAEDLITARLKDSLPDFKNAYEALNYGTMGKAFLPYEETGEYVKNTKALNMFKDSIAILQQLITAKKTGIAGSPDTYRKRMQELTDSEKIKSDSINSGKSAYVPEQLFKITHAYKVKDKSGMEKTTEEAYYFDKDFKAIIKVQKIY